MQEGEGREWVNFRSNGRRQVSIRKWVCGYEWNATVEAGEASQPEVGGRAVVMRLAGRVRDGRGASAKGVCVCCVCRPGRPSSRVNTHQDRAEWGRGAAARPAGRRNFPSPPPTRIANRLTAALFDVDVYRSLVPFPRCSFTDPNRPFATDTRFIERQQRRRRRRAHL